MTKGIYRGMGTPAIIAIVAIAVVIIGTAYYNTRPQGEIMMEKGADMMEEGEAMMEEGGAMMKDGEAMMDEGEAMMQGEGDAMMTEETGAMMDNGDAMMTHDGYQGEVLAGVTSGPVLLDFNKADYDKAISEGKLVTLFFFANWCPICKVEFPRMIDAFNELMASSDSAVQDVVGFRVNYNDNQTDSDEKALAREFGVGYQHTKVFIQDGKRILKSPDGWDKDRYITEIKNALKN